MAAVAGYDEVATAMIGAKGGSLPSIRVMGRLIGLLIVTAVRWSPHRHKVCSGASVSLWIRRNKARHGLIIQLATWQGAWGHSEALWLDLFMRGGRSWLDRPRHDDDMGARRYGKVDATGGPEGFSCSSI